MMTHTRTRGVVARGSVRAATPRQAARRRGPLDAAMDPEFFRALADPTRVKLVACIAKCGRGCSVGEVAQCCSVDLSVVSRHLALLARAGVLDAARRGRTVLYAVRYESVSGRLRAMADALEGCCRVGKGGDGCGSGCGNGNGGPCDGGCC